MDETYYSREAIESRLDIAHEIFEYRRHTEYGVIEIYFKVLMQFPWAIGLGLTVIPLLIDEFANGGKVLLNQETHYFDANSGKEITQSQAEENKNKNKQADLLAKEGIELHKQSKYQEAIEKFQQAFQTCTDGYSEQNRFKNNRNIASNNWADDLNEQGLELMNKADFKGASKKFNDAFNICTREYKNELAFKDNIDHAKAEIENEIGNLLFNKANYKGAMKCYQEAIDKCPAIKTDSLKKYWSNRSKAIDEKLAKQLKEMGDYEFNSGRYYNAQVKYEEACGESEINKSTYITYANNAEAELLNEEGDVLFSQRKYMQAIAKYQAAYQICSSESTLDKYKNNESKTQVELDAIDIKQQGDREFKSGKYSYAQIKYQEAYDKSNVKSNQATYITCVNKAKAEALNEEGDILYIEGKYVEAITKYQAAIDLHPSKSSSFLSCIWDIFYPTEVEGVEKYTSNINKAKIEIDARELKELGDEEFNSGKYDSAEDKYHQAYDKTTESANKSVYGACVNKAKGFALWVDDWNIENNNNSNEETSQLLKANEFFKQAHQLDPDDQQYAEWYQMSCLKLEGNELFNEGLKSQHKWIILLEASKKKKDEEINEIVTEQFQDAKHKFIAAKEKFKMGCKNDQRFESCIQFVQAQIDEIQKRAECDMIFESFNKLDINVNDNQKEFDSSESKVTEQQQI